MMRNPLGPHGLDLEDQERHPGHDTAVASLVKDPASPGGDPRALGLHRKGLPRKDTGKPILDHLDSPKGPFHSEQSSRKTTSTLRKRHPDSMPITTPAIRAPAAESTELPGPQQRPAEPLGKDKFNKAAPPGRCGRVSR